jgi:hypothetical protein
MIWMVNMNLGYTGWSCMDLIELAQKRDQCRALVNTAIDIPAT